MLNEAQWGYWEFRGRGGRHCGQGLKFLSECMRRDLIAGAARYARRACVRMLAVVGAAGMQTGCDNGNLERSGMFSPMSFETTPVKIQINDNRLNIPANCIDSPLEHFSEKDGFSVENASLLVGLLPEAKCRTRDNVSEFNIVGASRPAVYVLIGGHGPRAKPDMVLKDIYDRAILVDKRIKKFSRKAVGSGIGRVISVDLTGPDFGYKESRDVYGDPSLGYFVNCSRWTYQPTYHGRRMVENCRHEFIFRGLIVSASYGRHWLPRQQEIQKKITNKLNSFTSG